MLDAAILLVLLACLLPLPPRSDRELDEILGLLEDDPDLYGKDFPPSRG